MWNWSAGGKPTPTTQDRSHSAATLPSQQQVPFAQKQYPGYTQQAQYSNNFFYGYQGTFQPGYASYPYPHNANGAYQTRYSQTYDRKPQFASQPRQVTAVSQLRKPDKHLKRKPLKQPSKPPIIKRKDKKLSDSSVISSTYRGTSSRTPSPRSVSPSSGEFRLTEPNLAQESVLGRASFLVLDDYRSKGNQSIGSRSTKSRTSGTAIREYRPWHIPDPVVPGFILSSDEEDDDKRDSESEDGKGYAKSLETTSLKSASRKQSTGSFRAKVPTVPAAPPAPPVPTIPKTDSIPTPPPFVPEQPLYATVNKDAKLKKPNKDKDDPIYFTIGETKKNSTNDATASGVDTSKIENSTTKPLTLLGELQQRLTLRSKHKTLEFSENPDLSGLSQSHQSAFRPYNALRASTFKMDNQSEAEYDIPIPIDKVILRDGSDTDSEIAAIETVPQEEIPQLTLEDHTNVDDNGSTVIHEPSGAIIPTKEDIYYKEGKSSVAGSFQTGELITGVHEQAADINTDPSAEIKGATSNKRGGGDNLQTLAVPAPVKQDQSSHISSALSQSNITTQSSNKSSQKPPLHDPITALDFKPKSILKNTTHQEDSSESSSEESEVESEKGPEEKERYHLTIPVDVTKPHSDDKHDKQIPVVTKTNANMTPLGSLRQAQKLVGSSSAHSSLRAAHASRSTSENQGSSSRPNTGVSFTSDTRDNEGLAKQYEKESLNLSEIYKGKISAADAVVKPNPLLDQNEEETTKPISEPPAPVHDRKAPEPKQPEPISPPVAIETESKPATKDQGVETDVDPIEINIMPTVQPSNQVINNEPAERTDYAVMMKSPRGILKHPNGSATLQLNQPNQLVISTPDKYSTLPNGSLNINTDLTGAHRGGRYSPNYKLGNHSPSSPSYAVRHTPDNISVVSITGYDPAWETRSNYSTDTIRTLDDFTSGTVRTMVSLGTFTNPYAGNEPAGNESMHYRRQISESSTDPLAFSMSYDNQMFEYHLQNKQNGGPHKKPRNKKREPKPTKTVAKKLPSTDANSVQKKTTFADHALGYDALFRKEKRKKRKRYIKIIAMIVVAIVVITTIALVIYFLTDKDNQQNSTDE